MNDIEQPKPDLDTCLPRAKRKRDTSPQTLVQSDNPTQRQRHAPPRASNQSGVDGNTVLMTALNLNHQRDSRTTSSLVNHMPNPTAKRHKSRPEYLTCEADR